MNFPSNKFLLFIVFFSLTPVLLNGAPHNKLLIKFAKKYYLMGKVEQAVEKADQVLATESRNATANLIHALGLLQQNKLENRLQAKRLLDEYVPRTPDQAFANFCMGIYQQYRKAPALAEKYFRKAVELDTSLVQALIQLGNLSFQNMLKYYNRYSDTPVALSFREYAIDDYDKAVDYLRRALKIDPTNATAAYLLGSVYYEMEEFQAMEELFCKTMEYNPDDKNSNLCLGLAYLAQNKYAQASACLDHAIEQMSESEKNLFLNPEILVPDNEQVETLKEAKKYWEQKDPMFLTPENERLMTHFVRVAYSNMRFGVPSQGIDGWMTDRGITYIRYGKPVYIIEYGKGLEVNAVFPPTQIWVYPDFQLMFSDEFWNGNYRFVEPFVGSNSPFKERTTVDYGLVAKNVFKTIPESYELEREGGSFQAPYQLAFFRGERETDVILSFGLPWKEDILDSTLEYSTGFFFLGEDSLPEYKITESLVFDYNANRERLMGRYLINGLEFHHQPGDYSYSFEILNRTLDQNFVDRRQVQIPDFGGNILTLSDLLLAHTIEPAEKEGPFVRNGFYILPNIEHVYSQEKTLFLYFEVYHLMPNVSGQVHYKVENKVTPAGTNNFFRKLLGRKRQSISIINEYSGTQTWDSVIQSIDLRNLQPGEYTLEIKVSDKIGFFESTQSTQLVVEETLNN